MSYCSHVLDDGSGCQCAPDLTEVVAEVERLRSALEEARDMWRRELLNHLLEEGLILTAREVDAALRDINARTEALGSSSVSQDPEGTEK